MLETLEYLEMLTRQQFSSADYQQGTNVWVAWMAGIFDGEGSVGIYDKTGKPQGNRNSRSWVVRTTITNTGAKLLDKVIEILEDCGLAYYVTKKVIGKPGWKPKYQILFSGFQRNKNFLEIIRPYLIDKAEEVDLTLEFINIRLAKGQGEPYGDREVEIANLVKSLKHTRHLRD